MEIVGAILGDIIGSKYEFIYKPIDYNNVELFTRDNFFTDDTVLSLAIKNAIDINNIKPDFKSSLLSFGKMYSNASYGTSFEDWLLNPVPYGSCGNGAPMRGIYIGEFYNNQNDIIKHSVNSCLCSHNHKQAIKATIVLNQCICFAKKGYDKKYIKNYASKFYNLEDNIKNNKQSELSQVSVPLAIQCFLETNNYEECMRKVLSVYNCDTDTVCAMSGSIAESYYKFTFNNEEELLKNYLDDFLFENLKKI